MQDSFQSQYSTAASEPYRISDSRNTTDVRRQLEDLVHRSYRLPRNAVKELTKQIEALFDRYEHDHLSSSRREQRPQVRLHRDQQVVPLNERDENTQLEVNNAPMHMIGQPALRRSQSQDLERSINRQAQSSARVSQPRQEPRLSLSWPERISQSVKVNYDDFPHLKNQGVAKIKRVPIKGRFNNHFAPYVPPHATYNKRKQEQPQKEVVPVPLQRQYSAHHFPANRRGTLTTEEIERYHSKNSPSQKKQLSAIKKLRF